MIARQGRNDTCACSWGARCCKHACTALAAQTEALCERHAIRKRAASVPCPVAKRRVCRNSTALGQAQQIMADVPQALRQRGSGDRRRARALKRRFRAAVPQSRAHFAVLNSVSRHEGTAWLRRAQKKALKKPTSPSARAAEQYTATAGRCADCTETNTAWLSRVALKQRSHTRGGGRAGQSRAVQRNALREQQCCALQRQAQKVKRERDGLGTHDQHGPAKR